MIDLGHAAPALINILIALFIPIENRHPAAPEEDNNHQGMCVCLFPNIIQTYYHSNIFTFSSS
jgi:hypothetical protein